MAMTLPCVAHAGRVLYRNLTLPQRQTQQALLAERVRVSALSPDERKAYVAEQARLKWIRELRAADSRYSGPESMRAARKV